MAKSSFNDQFILKGGILIASFVGQNKRTTQDLDMAWIGPTLSEERVLSTISAIASVNLDDGVKFVPTRIKPITTGTDHPGWRVFLKPIFFKIDDNIHIDIVSSDISNEYEVKHGYRSMFENKYIDINTQSLEGVLVDKFLASNQYGVGNSRMKDFYDMFVFTTFHSADISPQLFAVILNHVVKKHGSQLGDVRGTIASIGASPILQGRWERYQQTHPYAASVTFQQTVEALAKLAKWAGFGPLNSRAGRSFGPR
jgi:hypothetical protein